MTKSLESLMTITFIAVYVILKYAMYEIAEVSDIYIYIYIYIYNVYTHMYLHMYIYMQIYVIYICNIYIYIYISNCI